MQAFDKRYLDHLDRLDTEIFNIYSNIHNNLAVSIISERHLFHMSILVNKRILIADPQPIYRQGLDRFLRNEFSITSISATGNFDELVSLLRTESFDFLILDINIPGGNQIRIIERIKLANPSMKILILTAYREKVLAFPCLKAGAHGFISKHASNEELYNAVRSILVNKIYISQEIRDNILLQIRYIPDLLDATDFLSMKEIDVSFLLISGLDCNQIAEKLSLSPSSIRKCKLKIFAKLNIRNLTELSTMLHYIYPPSYN